MIHHLRHRGTRSCVEMLQHFAGALHVFHGFLLGMLLAPRKADCTIVSLSDAASAWWDDQGINPLAVAATLWGRTHPVA